MGNPHVRERNALARSIVTIKPANLVDALEIAHKLRYEDIREIEALSGLTPKEAIQTSLMASQGLGKAYIAYVNESPEVLFGVSGSNTIGVGHPWLLGSSAISELPIRFVRLSLRFIKEFQEIFPILTNIIDLRNTIYLKWLEHMGFRIIKEYPNTGPGRITVAQFVRLGE